MGIIADDEYWMRRAHALAEQAKAHGEVPVGAILVSADNQCLSEGFNQVISLNDPSAHAEIQALRQASALLKNYRLTGTTLYVTLEPCAMCAGAIVHARIARLVFALRDLKAGAAGSCFNLLSGAPLNHRVEIDEGVLIAPCRALLQDFFKQRRD